MLSALASPKMCVSLLHVLLFLPRRSKHRGETPFTAGRSLPLMVFEP